MRLCAASRPGEHLAAESSSVSPGFQLATSLARQRVEIDALRALVVVGRPVHVGPQVEAAAGRGRPGPEPSSTKCAWRVAAQFGIIATGLLAAWVGYVAILTSSTVVRPPSPCAPMPSALTFVAQLDAQLLESCSAGRAP